jgi:hypothetical protein
MNIWKLEHIEDMIIGIGPMRSSTNFDDIVNHFNINRDVIVLGDFLKITLASTWVSTWVYGLR